MGPNPAPSQLLIRTKEGAYITNPEESSNHVGKTNVKSIERLPETGNDYKDDEEDIYGTDKFDLDNYNLDSDTQESKTKMKTKNGKKAKKPVRTKKVKKSKKTKKLKTKRRKKVKKSKKADLGPEVGQDYQDTSEVSYDSYEDNYEGDSADENNYKDPTFISNDKLNHFSEESEESEEPQEPQEANDGEDYEMFGDERGHDKKDALKSKAKKSTKLVPKL